MLCLLVYVKLFKGSSGRRKVDRVTLVLVLTFLSFSLAPGGTRWRVRRKDKREITSVMSEKAKVCQKDTSLPQAKMSSPSSAS